MGLARFHCAILLHVGMVSFSYHWLASVPYRTKSMEVVVVKAMDSKSIGVSPAQVRILPTTLDTNEVSFSTNSPHQLATEIVRNTDWTSVFIIFLKEQLQDFPLNGE